MKVLQILIPLNPSWFTSFILLIRKRHIFLRIKTEGDPSSKDGDATAVDGNQGPALPWEQSAQMQG